jgi:hypothetical protein
MEGWLALCDRGFYSGDWLKRAAAAKGGIYGNEIQEAAR